MAKKLDTSWFDLKNYEALKTMSIQDWQKLLGERFEFHRLVNSCREGCYEFTYERGAYFQCDFLDSLVPPEELLMKISSLLKQGVITNFGLGSFPVRRTLNNPMTSGSSVNNLTVHDVVKMSNDYRLKIDTPNNEETLQKKQKHWQEMLSKSFEEEGYAAEETLEAVVGYYGKEKFEAVYEAVFDDGETLQEKQEHWQKMLSESFEEGYGGNAIIKIDLFATDAKLRNDFDQWLKHTRESTGYNSNIPKNISKEKLSNKELYTQKDFDHWIKFGVIPYLDLMLVAEIEYKEISQPDLALIIFPDEPNPDPDTFVRIYQVTKPLAEHLIKNRMYKTLSTQLDYQISPT